MQHTDIEIIFPRIDEQNEVIYPNIDELGGAGKPPVPDWLFANIAELSKRARTVHAIYVGFVIYWALTLISTPDRKLVFDEQAHLPIINLDVPFSGFIVLAPIAAIFIFMDFQIHLHMLKEAINKAKMLYAPLDSGHLRPWLLNLIEEPEPGMLGRMQRFMINLSIWCLMPIVLTLDVLVTLKKRNSVLTVSEWFVACLGISLLLWLWHRYDNMHAESGQVRKEDTKLEKLINTLVSNWKKNFFVATMALFLLIMIAENNRIRTNWFRVDLSNQSLVSERKEEMGGYWANLQGMHFDRANLYRTYIKKGDLRRAKLQYSNLQFANLEEANLSDADMEGATLSEAKLQQANLSGANLSYTNFNCATLTKANFLGANLSDAFLLGADLTGANVSSEQLLSVSTLYRAKLDPPLTDYITKHRPELLSEPDSEDTIKQQFPSARFLEEPIDRATLEKINQNQWKAITITILADFNKVVLVKAGSNSYLRIERFIHFKVRGGESERLGRGYLREPVPAPCAD